MEFGFIIIEMTNVPNTPAVVELVCGGDVAVVVVDVAVVVVDVAVVVVPVDFQTRPPFILLPINGSLSSF